MQRPSSIGWAVLRAMNIFVSNWRMFESPIFAPIFSYLRLFCQEGELKKPPSVSRLNATLALTNIRFVAQNQGSGHFEDWYEPRICLKGEVSTRDESWHDFFNALSWAAFPNAKRVINRLQYEAQKDHYPSKQRTSLENMLALFDENGAVVVAKDKALLKLIQDHQWHEIFWQNRDKFGSDISVTVFGHGLFEKAMRPYVGLTAPALLFCEDSVDSVDTIVAQFIEDGRDSLHTKLLSPLPILGIPGWWGDNEDESFYLNESYFRKKSSRK